MKQWLQKILVSLAILLVCGHNVFPHHHNDEDSAVEQHHGHDNEDHGFFGGAHLDESFVPAKIQYDFHFNSTPLVFSLPFNELNLVLTFVYKKTDYSLQKEFPPPVRRPNTFLLRGPPVA